MTAPSLQVYIQGQGSVNSDNLNTFEQTCNNVVDLRAFVGALGVQVYMRGYVSAGDGGQGEFYWNASGTGPDDNGITNIVPTNAAVGCWTRLSNTGGGGGGGANALGSYLVVDSSNAPINARSFGIGGGSLVLTDNGAGSTFLLGTSALSGDVTSSANNFNTSITGNAVTYGKIQQASPRTLIGNSTSSTANVQEITLGAGLAFSGSALTLTTVGGLTIYVTQYGATGNGTTDDTAAINAAFAAVRAAVSTSLVSQGATLTIVFDAGTYLISDSINVTGIQAINFIVQGNGACILAKCTGKPAIDMLGSRWFTVNDLSIWGDSTLVPTYGVQIGRISSASVGDGCFNNLTIQGYYSVACFYNFAAEGMVYNKPRFYNDSSAASSYCLIMDSNNYQNITSAFITETSPVGTARSFNEQLFNGSDMRKEVTGRTILMMGDSISRHYYFNAYAVSVDDVIVELFKVTTCKDLMLDMHVETTGSTKYLLIDNVNPSSSVNLFGLQIRDHNPQCSVCMIDVTGATRSVLLYGCDLDFGDPSNTVPVFGSTAADASKILFDGIIKWPSSKTISIANGYVNGTIETQSGTTVTNTVGTYNILRSPSSAGVRVQQLKGILQVAGTAAGTDLSNYLQAQGSATGGTVTIASAGSDTDVPLDLAAQGAGALTMASANVATLVGIGLTNPGTKLHVKRSTSSANAMFTIEEAGVGDCAHQFLITGVTAFVHGLDNSDSDKYKMAFANNGFATPVVTLTSAALLTLGTAGTSSGSLALTGSSSGLITIQPAAAAGTYTLTLPTDDGTANQFLQTDGSGVLTWASGNSGTVTSVAVSGGTTGLTTSGGPITTSGTITLAGTLGVANGGTGTTTAFTQGSVVFAGSSGIYAQDNSNFFWNSTSHSLGIQTTSFGSVARLTINPVVTVDNLANVQITANAATSRPLVVQGFTSQSADLQEWQNSAGTAVASITSAGAIKTGTGSQFGTTGGDYITIGKVDPFDGVRLIAVTGASTLQVERGDNSQEGNIICLSVGLQNAGVGKGQWNSTGIALISTGLFKFSNSTSGTNTIDTGLARNAAGIVEVNNGTPGTYRDLQLRSLLITGTSSGLVTLTGAAAAGTWTLTVPTSGGSANQFLQTNGSGTTTWANVSGANTWTEVTGTSQAASVNNGYILNNAGLVTLTLPATAAVGEIIEVSGKGAGGWLVAQNSGQAIHFGNTNTTTGVAGSLASTNRYDTVKLLCITANTDFIVLSNIGNLTVV